MANRFRVLALRSPEQHAKAESGGCSLALASYRVSGLRYLQCVGSVAGAPRH